MAGAAWVIRPLGVADAERYVALRRQGLLETPLAFGASPEDDFAGSPEGVRDHLRQGPGEVWGTEPDALRHEGRPASRRGGGFSHAARGRHRGDLRRERGHAGECDLPGAARHDGHHPGLEGRGIGQTLLSLAVEWLRSFEPARVWLGASSDPATRSYGFYRSVGWRPVGE